MDSMTLKISVFGRCNCPVAALAVQLPPAPPAPQKFCYPAQGSPRGRLSCFLPGSWAVDRRDQNPPTSRRRTANERLSAAPAMMNGGSDMARGGGNDGAWSTQDTPMLSSPDDDFQQFLDMGGMANLPDPLQFDFGGEFDSSNGGDTTMTGTGMAIQTTTSTVIPMTSAVSMPAIQSQMVSPAGNDPIMNIDAQIQMLQNQKMQVQHQQQQEQQRQRQQELQRQQQQQQQSHERRMQEQQAMFFAQQNRIVPPTPQSSELHQQSGYDQFHRLREQQDMAFTPLVSPAVPPLETQFSNENQFAVNPSYFTPISSPALHSQNESMSYERLASLTVNSPVDMVMDPNLSSATGIVSLPAPAPIPAPAPSHSSTPALPPSADLNKKARKANAASKTRSKGSSKSSVRQSPITKPQKKRTASTPNIAKHVINELVGNAPSSASPTNLLPAPAQSAIATDTSEEDGSVSPEAISEMPPPPPPPPRSARQSPYIQSQKKRSTPKAKPASQVSPSPATPASLLRLPSPSIEDTIVVANGSDVVSPENIDNFELPESVTSKAVSRPGSKQPSPKTSSNQATPKGTVPPPLPSPVLTRPPGTISASQSPQIAPGSSGPVPNRKTPQLAPRNGKKRSSASVQSSPALRPRISPGMKPILPANGTVSVEDTASQLLTSKSNYQNMLEGNKVPGMEFPRDLTDTLTSKRTSHKIAEQGRRNRINTALQEIATLLPLDEKSECKEKLEKKEPKQSNGPNSKASTVELAIEYIKELQNKVEAEKERADAAERKLQELKTP
ncbi:hypothetical protein MKZ38_008637 [Zalerion maritima]|uniref:BHLH domain-containing protein n=1 Tax=Zalerion maritima TaxID=339359 RepID=A0AAD5WY18_9PEZI|nr:hypothetical protein MKZ38_008637 [Zalerion maritima]